MSSIPIDHLGRDDLITLHNRVAARLAIVSDNHSLVGMPQTPIACHKMTSSDLQWQHIGIGDRGMRRSMILGTHIYTVQTVLPRLVLSHIRAKQVHRHIPLTESWHLWRCANCHASHGCNDVQVQPGRCRTQSRYASNLLRALKTQWPRRRQRGNFCDCSSTCN